MNAQQAASLANLEKGALSARVFIDRDVYDLEMERIFTRSWLFVAHETEIPNAGDFVTRFMGEDAVIVVRGNDGQVRVLLNTCRHRGRRVCEMDNGNASHFRCPFHGWTYNNHGELTGVPYLDCYDNGFDKKERGLYAAAAVDTYQQLLYATWNPDAEPLAEYLGEMKWVLDLLFGRSGGMQVAGAIIDDGHAH